MLSFYFFLTGRPASMWDMMELNLCDWAWPNENGPFAFGRIGEEIDNKMRDLFWEQDKYHVRTNFKSVVELYDRGLEFFRSPLLAGAQGEQVGFLMDPFMRAITSEAKRKNFEADFSISEKTAAVLNALKRLEMSLQDKLNDEEMGEEARKMLEGLQKASPLSLFATTMLMMKCWHLQNTRFRSGHTEQFVRTESLMQDIVLKNPTDRMDVLPTTMMKMEYRTLMWLMKRGDYWQRVKGKVFGTKKVVQEQSEDKPTTLSDLETFLNDTELGRKYVLELEDVLSYPGKVAQQTKLPASSIGKILESAHVNDLQLAHVPLRDTLVHPEFTLPGLTWKGTQHYDEQLQKQVQFHYDYAMLRGPSHPDMDLILHRRSSSWRQSLMQQGERKFESYVQVMPSEAKFSRPESVSKSELSW